MAMLIVDLFKNNIKMCAHVDCWCSILSGATTPLVVGHPLIGTFAVYILIFALQLRSAE
jgi:hypothetical protein